jgi:hypothetical protein
MDDFDTRDPGLPEAARQIGGQLFRGHRHDLRPPSGGLSKRFVYVAACRQRGNGVALGKLLDNGEGALADGTGGPENGKSFQNSFQLLASSF